MNTNVISFFYENSSARPSLLQRNFAPLRVYKLGLSYVQNCTLAIDEYEFGKNSIGLAHFLYHFVAQRNFSRLRVNSRVKFHASGSAAGASAGGRTWLPDARC